MSKTLVAYFSASGVTKEAAQKLAQAAGADLFEIKPEILYTQADLNWMDKKSRSSVEMNDTNARPGIAETLGNMGEYKTVFVGFPIWWYREPSIIDTFLESYAFDGTRIIPFATSGGSGLGKTVQRMRELAPKAEILEGKMLNGNLTEAELKNWIEGLSL